MSGALTNIHATGLVAGQSGILITGASGTGKTTLALAILRELATFQRHAAMIADDQVLVEAAGGKLLAHAPPAIAGLVEVYGIGPQPIGFRHCAVIDLVIDLVDGDPMPRMQDENLRQIAGVSVPLLIAPARQAVTALNLVQKRIDLAPFAR